MIVHQVLSGAGPYDAVTTEALDFRRCFNDWGWGGTDVAASSDPRMGRRVGGLETLSPAPEDVLLVHYSAYAPKVARVLTLPNRTLLLNHNVTPAHWLWEHEPAIAVQCAVGRAQLPEFVRASDALAADSAFNAAELHAAGAGEVTVVPVLSHPERLGAPGPPDPPGPPTVLFVGRLMPHKRQDAVIRAFGLYAREHAPDARLVLVGEPVTPRYGEQLRALADAVAPGAVTFEQSLPAADLGHRFRAAHVFLCLSEHEGFCVPVLEALRFGVPVIARPAGAVPEVTGDAALLADDEDLAVIAELLALAVGDEELRADLRERGVAQAAAFTPERSAEALRGALEALG
ncbi:MAG TPA: glycosyltransferase [Solirubrobacteraceae bacterium]|nr:glycosyltransferase [Solirubrobacteraceae bacterium]